MAESFKLKWLVYLLPKKFVFKYIKANITKYVQSELSEVTRSILY